MPATSLGRSAGASGPAAVFSPRPTIRSTAGSTRPATVASTHWTCAGCSLVVRDRRQRRDTPRPPPARRGGRSPSPSQGGGAGAAPSSLVIFGSEDGTVYALDAETGSERWRISAGGPVVSAPVLVGDTVAIGSDDGTVFGLDAATGQERWQYTAGGAIEAPIVADDDGTLYVASRDGTLAAFDPSSCETTCAASWEAKVGVLSATHPPSGRPGLHGGRRRLPDRLRRVVSAAASGRRRKPTSRHPGPRRRALVVAGRTATSRGWTRMASSNVAGPAPTRWGRSTRSRGSLTAQRPAAAPSGSPTTAPSSAGSARPMPPARPSRCGQRWHAARPHRRSTAACCLHARGVPGRGRRPRPEPQRPPARPGDRARRPHRDDPRRRNRLADRPGRGRRHAAGHRRDRPPGTRSAERTRPLVDSRRPDQPASPDSGRRPRALAHRAANQR